MSHYTIYHNPRCTKSRQALKLLGEHNIDPEIRLYLTDAPSQKELKALLTLLKVPAITICRTKEKTFADVGLTKDSPDQEIIRAISINPILLERPIVIKNNKKAAIGRPTENIEKLF